MIKSYSAQVTEVNTQDSYWPFVQGQNTTFNNLIPQKVTPYYDLSRVIGGVLVQMDFDKLIIKRQVYNYGDWLGLVGGFMGSL